MGNLVKLCRAGDRALQLLLFNEEYLVSVSHQLALITSLPFVHTARRYYRLNGSVRSLDWRWGTGNWPLCREFDQTESFRGSKSRNKVSVGEPAEGSLVITWDVLALSEYVHSCTNPNLHSSVHLRRLEDGIGSRLCFPCLCFQYTRLFVF